MKNIKIVLMIGVMIGFFLIIVNCFYQYKLFKLICFLTVAFIIGLIVIEIIEMISKARRKPFQ